MLGKDEPLDGGVPAEQASPSIAPSIAPNEDVSRGEDAKEAAVNDDSTSSSDSDSSSNSSVTTKRLSKERLIRNSWQRTLTRNAIRIVRVACCTALERLRAYSCVEGGSHPIMCI